MLRGEGAVTRFVAARKLALASPMALSMHVCTLGST